MELKYGVGIDELMDFFSADHEGFSEQEINAAQQHIGVALPERYQHFLRRYGNDDINYICNEMNAPDEIWTSYQVIQDCLENVLKEDFEKAERDGKQDEYADNPYFTLWHLPVEQWNTITENYVYIWHENQGVWNAGFLMSDLQAKNPNPPIYISIDDDDISFKKYTNTIEEFLFQMLIYADRYDELYESEQRIAQILSENGIDVAKLHSQSQYPNESPYCFASCLDNEKNILYLYYAQKDREELYVFYGGEDGECI